QNYPRSPIMPSLSLKAIPNPGAVEQEIFLYAELRAQLQSEVPDLDEDFLTDTLEGLSTLPDLLAGVVRSHLADVTLAEALRARIEEMRERCSRMEVRADKKKAFVASAMERAEMHKLMAPDFTASLRPSPPAVVILEEERIPEVYWKPQAPRLDKAALAVVL